MYTPVQVKPWKLRNPRLAEAKHLADKRGDSNVSLQLQLIEMKKSVEAAAKVVEPAIATISNNVHRQTDECRVADQITALFDGGFRNKTLERGENEQEEQCDIARSEPTPGLSIPPLPRTAELEKALSDFAECFGVKQS